MLTNGVEVDGLALLIHGPVEIDTSATHFDVGLIDMPATYWAAPSPTQTFLEAVVSTFLCNRLGVSERATAWLTAGRSD